MNLPIAKDTVFRPFCTNSLANLHTQFGYVNFGFKAISSASNCHNHKYSDRGLYKVIANAIAKSKQETFSSFELIQNFSVQKAGNALSECEDIWQNAEQDGGVAIALSDGATESSFAREWAKELVTAFVSQARPSKNLDNGNTPAWLLPLQTNWQQWLGNQNLSWFAKRKAEEGTFATFLSLEVFPDLSWQSLAVGDSCLFVVRDHLLQKSFPLQNSQEFNNRPRLIGTHIKTPDISISQMKGTAQYGDRFYLTTDAIACWVFKQLEANQNPWLKLDRINSQDLLSEWVSELRERHEIANDDTTLLCLEVNICSANRCRY